MKIFTLLIKNFLSCIVLLLICISTAFAQTDESNSTEESATDASNSSSSSSESSIVSIVPGLNSEFFTNSVIQDRNNNGLLEFVAFGDSITRGVGDLEAVGSEVFQTTPVEDGEAGFPLRVELLLGISISNLGDPGEKLSTAGLFRFAEAIPVRKPDIVFIGGGSNDAFLAVTKDEYFRAVQTMLNIAQASGTLPVIMTTPPSCCNHAGIGFFTDRYNDAIRTLAAVNEVPLADIHKGFTNTCTSSECFLLNLPEGLHPNIKGYDVMGEVLIASLLNINIFAPLGPSTLELALNLPVGSVVTVPDAPLVTAENSETNEN